MSELDRLFAALVRVLRDSRPEYLAQPFEVAELMGFVPYRTVRTAIGTETNDDYAHVVMRLLSGEGGYIFADEMLQDDMRNELSSPNPNLAVYRSYLNARVALSQDHTRRALERMESLDPAPDVAPTTAVETALETALDAAPVVPHQPESELSALANALADLAAAPVRPRAAGSGGPGGPGGPACTHCGHTLPDGRAAHFCPNCGQNVLARRCAACSSELEAGWKFCITCGRSST